MFFLLKNCLILFVPALQVDFFPNRANNQTFVECFDKANIMIVMVSDNNHVSALYSTVQYSIQYMEPESKIIGKFLIGCVIAVYSNMIAKYPLAFLSPLRCLFFRGTFQGEKFAK
jgi:hypothetical protein